jgi:site-specific recombinase XerD
LVWPRPGDAANLEAFRAWCDTRDLREAQQLTRDHCEAYQRALFHHRTAADRPLSVQAQRLRLVELRGFGKWLARRRHLAYNPAGDLTMPRTERLLPHPCPDVEPQPPRDRSDRQEAPLAAPPGPRPPGPA